MAGAPAGRYVGQRMARRSLPVTLGQSLPLTLGRSPPVTLGQSLPMAGASVGRCEGQRIAGQPLPVTGAAPPLESGDDGTLWSLLSVAVAS